LLIQFIYQGVEQLKKDRKLLIRLIETTGKYAPLLVFPEGGTTNGSALLKFK
jgi:hypothetical protein